MLNDKEMVKVDFGAATVQQPVKPEKSQSRIRWQIIAAVCGITAICLTLFVVTFITKSHMKHREISDDDYDEDRSLNLGLLASMDGDGSQFGAGVMHGAMNAVGEESLKGHKVNLIPGRTNGNPLSAVMEAERLYNLGVRHFIGPVTSQEVIAVAEWSMRKHYEILIVTPSATSLELRRFPFVMTMTPDDSSLARTMIKRASALRPRDVLVIHRDDSYGHSLKSEIERNIADQLRSGGTRTLGVSYPVDDTLMSTGRLSLETRAELEKQLKALEVEMMDTSNACVIVVGGPETIDILELGAQVPKLQTRPWYGTDGIGLGDETFSSPTAASMAHQVLFSVFTFVGNRLTGYKRSAELDTMASLNRDKTPQMQSLNAFDAVTLILDATKAFGTTNGHILASKMIERDFTHNGITGDIKFDRTGNRITGYYGEMTLSPIYDSPWIAPHGLPGVPDDQDIDIVKMPSDTVWMMHGFHNASELVPEHGIDRLYGVDEITRQGVMDLLKRRNVSCVQSHVEYRTRDVITHRVVTSVFTLNTLPLSFFAQSLYGWDVSVTCNTDKATTEHYSLGCTAFDAQQNRMCTASIEGAGMAIFPPGSRRLLQTTASGSVDVVCNTVDPICKAMRNVFELIPSGGTGNVGMTVVKVVFEAVCSLGSTSCNIAANVRTNNLSTSVICSELYRQGRLPTNVYLGDTEMGSFLEETRPYAMMGYHSWAKPIVSLMQQSESVTRIAEMIGKPWAEHMAFIRGRTTTDNRAGAILYAVALPLNDLLGYVLAHLSYIIAVSAVAMCILVASKRH